jgi:hypothetical protein
MDLQSSAKGRRSAVGATDSSGNAPALRGDASGPAPALDGGASGRVGFARLEGALFAVASAALLLSQLGYSFERGDQLQYLLLPYRSFEPNFLPGDWFTWQTTHYHQTFSWLVIALHAIAGDALPVAVLVAHVAVLLALGYAVWRLSHALGFGWPHAAFALIVLALVRDTGLAGDTLNHGQLVPSDIALPPFLLACAAWVERRTLLAGVALGVSGLFHANFAVLGPLVLVPPEAWLALRERSPRHLLRLLAPYALIASPTLLLTALGFIAADEAPEAIAIVHRIRSPHHYDVTAFPSQDVWWLALVLLAGLPAWRADDWARHNPRRRWLMLAISAVLALGLVGSLLHVQPLVRLFAWRLSVALILIALLIAAEAGRRIIAERNWTGVAWLVACAAVLAVFARDDAATVAPWGVRGAWFALPAALPLAAGGVWLARRALAIPRAAMALLAAVPLAWSASIAAQPLSAGMADDDDAARGVRGPRLGSFQLLAKPRGIFDKARTQTPPDARFLIPPSLIGFRLHARRAVFVDWKCVPMKGEEALEWQRRMLAVMGSSQFPARGYELRKIGDELYYRRNTADLAALARKEGLDHIVLYKRAYVDDELGLERVYSAGRWRVYRVLSPVEMANRKPRKRNAGARPAPL